MLTKLPPEGTVSLGWVAPRLSSLTLGQNMDGSHRSARQCFRRSKGSNDGPGGGGGRVEGIGMQHHAFGSL